MKKHIAGLVLLLFCLNPWAIVTAQSASKTQPPSGLFDLYEQNRQQGIANYITTDFLLLAYSMIRQQDTIMVEQKQIVPALGVLFDALGKGVVEGTDDVSLANQDFLRVLTALLQGTDPKTLRAAGAQRGAAELELVVAATGVAVSPLWGYAIDYSQFKPRGAYSSAADRAQYFRAMRYASAVLFAVKQSKATGIDAKLADRLTGQALQLATVLQGDKNGLQAYLQINTALEFRFGKADDLELDDLFDVAAAKPADVASARTLLFEVAEKTGRKPRILGGIVNRDRLEKNVTAADVLVGFRLFPQRYSSDSAMFQKLVSAEGGGFQGTGSPFGLTVIGGKPVKGFPSSYELMAALGSSSAATFVDQQGENKFAKYAQVVEVGKVELAGATGLDALHNMLLGSLVRNVSVDKEDARLTTGQAFWTWQRYVNLLYTKQSVTMTGKSLEIEQTRKGARLEDALDVYLALYRLVNAQKLSVGNSDWSAWGGFLDIISRCIEINNRQNLLVELSEDDEDFLNSLDRSLEDMTAGKDFPIVVDVHTEPSSAMVVEEAVGYPVVVRENEKLRGGRLSHFEFKHPLSDRLTNEKWQQMVVSESIPQWQ